MEDQKEKEKGEDKEENRKKEKKGSDGEEEEKEENVRAVVGLGPVGGLGLSTGAIQ